MDDVELTIKNIFGIIPKVMSFEGLTENEQVSIRMALINMQYRAMEEGRARAYRDFPYCSSERNPDKDGFDLF